MRFGKSRSFPLRDEPGAGELPAEVTGFVGRRRELAEVVQLLGTSRLLTLTGAGGVGKTRLALRAAHRVRRNYGDGVRLVQLAALREPGLLCHAIAHALAVQDHTPRSLQDVLAAHLAGCELLLVLDTCEHLIDACAQLAETLLRATPKLRILATSREPLNAMGEQVFHVAPLPVPDPDGGEEVDSVRLFVERAMAADPSFELTPQTRPAVARVCARLEGIPLALELAAARLRVLSVEEISERLGDRFQLLRNGGRTAPSRHQTLRSAIGWSHELCEPAERLLWARLSVFAGTFDLAAVQQVCADGRLPGREMFELLAALVDKSVITREHGPSGVRFGMLETLREYGAEWLRVLGEERTLRRRHGDHYLALAVRAERYWFGPDQIGWLRRLRCEHPNFRAALKFGVAAGDAYAAQRMAAALQIFWTTSGLISEGRLWLERALALRGAPHFCRAWALCSAGAIAIFQGDPDAAGRLLAEADALARRLGDPRLLAQLTVQQGVAAALAGRPKEADRPLADALALIAALEEPKDIFLVQVLLSLAVTGIRNGRPDEAIAHCLESQTRCRARGDRTLLAYTLIIQARAEWSTGDLRSAAAHLRQAVRLRRTEPDPAALGLSVELLAWIATANGDPQRAAVLLGAAHRLWWTFGLAGLRNTVLPAHERCAEQTRDALGEAAFQQAHREGAALTQTQIIDCVLAGHRSRRRPGR